MSKCDYCRHVEVCGLRESLGERCCDFFDDGNKTGGKWIEHQEGRWIYAKCSHCGTVHDTQTNYCPTCGFAMERTDI